MSKTFRQWVFFTMVCVAAGFMVNAMCASLGATSEETRNQVRMTVDFTVLPVVMPDGSEIQPEAADTPDAASAETAAADQALPEPETEAAPMETPTPPEAGLVEQAKPTPPPAAAGPGVVKSVSLEETGDGFTVTVATDREVKDTSYLNLANPRRLVLDLRGNWTYRGRNVIRSSGAVKHIVIGEHKDRFRMVVHFRKPPAGNVEPQFKPTENKLHVMVPLP